MWKTSGHNPILLPHYLLCAYKWPSKLMLLFIDAVWGPAWNGKGTTPEKFFQLCCTGCCIDAACTYLATGGTDQFFSVLQA